MLKVLLMTAALLGVVAVLLVGALVAFQDRLLYLPTRTGLQAFTGDDLQAWPDRQDVRGLISRSAEESTFRGTVIVFHGNAGHAGQRRHYVPVFEKHGLRVILAEYPGYGPRAGRPSEQTLVDDAVRTLELAQERYGGPVLVVGVSLGAAVASAAASRVREAVAGLILITPWNQLASVAASHYPWLPVRRLLRERWDSAASLRGFGRPVAVVLAGQDTIIAPGFGRELFDSLVAGGTPASLFRIDAAGHNDWSGFVDDAWWLRVLGAAGGLVATDVPWFRRR